MNIPAEGFSLCYNHYLNSNEILKYEKLKLSSDAKKDENIYGDTASTRNTSGDGGGSSAYSANSSRLKRTNAGKSSRKCSTEQQAYVLDRDELLHQRPRVEKVWRDAVATVVSRMYELQKEEQTRLRQDPFAAMLMSASKINEEDFVVRRKPEALKSNKGARPLASPKQVGASTARADDDAIELEDDTSASPVVTTTTTSQTQRQDSQRQGAQCGSCGSTNTRPVDMTNPGSSGVSKSETWGFAIDTDREHLVTYCMDCHLLTH